MAELMLTGRNETVDSGYIIPRNADGLPLFPDIDFNKTSPEVVKKVLEGYFLYLWGMLCHTFHIFMSHAS